MYAPTNLPADFDRQQIAVYVDDTDYAYRVLPNRGRRAGEPVNGTGG
jgi:hypothetical protein